MFFKSKKKGDVKPLLVLDIGTEFIKTVLFRLTDKNQVEVIGYDRTPQKQNAMRGALIINLEEVIDEVDVSIGKTIHQAEQLLNTSVAAPKQVIMGIAGELVKGVPIVVGVDREKEDRKIVQAEIDEIIEQIKIQTFDSAVEDIAAETGIRANQIQEINTSVNSVYIDGIKVDSPIGFKGKELEYRVFSTFAPKIHLESIKEVANSLNLEILQVVVEPYAVALAMESSTSENFNGIFIDVGGGTTDLAVVEQGAMIGTKMFAFGGRVFTKRLELDLGLDYSTAEQMKIDYTDQKLGNYEEKQIRQALAKDMPIWIDGVEAALQDLEEIDVYPSQFYLCGGGALLPEIQQKLLAHPWLQTLPFGKFPRAKYIFPNQVRDVIDLTKKATHPLDVTPLAIARMVLD